MSQQSFFFKLTHTLLNGRNYLSWVRVVTLSFSNRGKLEFITGENLKPQPRDLAKLTEDEKKSFREWQIQDHQVMILLLGSIKPQILDIFQYAEHSQRLWEMVEELYGQEKNFSHICQLKQEIAQIKQANQPNSEYVGELRKKIKELKSLSPHNNRPNRAPKKKWKRWGWSSPKITSTQDTTRYDTCLGWHDMAWHVKMCCIICVVCSVIIRIVLGFYCRRYDTTHMGKGVDMARNTHRLV